MSEFELVVHPVTQRLLEALSQKPPHALLLAGPAGMGKRALAEQWAAKVLGDHATELQIIEPDEKGTISIDIIRTLYKATRAKHQGQRAIIIDHAEAMGTEAQNALLKLLEEPLPGNVLVLTAPTQSALLPTITSRVQLVDIRPVSATASQRLLQAHGLRDQQKQLQLLFVAAGRPAELTRLATDEAYMNVQTALAQKAKELFSAPVFERLAGINELAKSRENTIQLLAIMERMIMSMLSRAEQPAALIAIAERLQQTIERIVANGNLRAQLLALFTSY